jgi:flavin reductase (DIM6/NTAB) family NADH-FMN oxidoreductase RutF
MTFNKETLDQLEPRYRATLINSLAGVKSVVLIGSKSDSGVSNLAIFNSLIHIGASPPLWGIIFRPDNGKRDTLTNILQNREFTLNFVAQSDLEKAHQTSAKFESSISEFTTCGFTEMYLNNFKVPFVAEAPVKVAMKMEERVDIQLNQTILIIGSIQYIEMDSESISKDGFVNHDQLGTLACAGLDAYYKPTLLKRLSYAKTDTWPTVI